LQHGTLSLKVTKIFEWGGSQVPRLAQVQADNLRAPGRQVLFPLLQQFGDHSVAGFHLARKFMTEEHARSVKQLRLLAKHYWLKV
jgi:hypothetical protein